MKIHGRVIEKSQAELTLYSDGKIARASVTGDASIGDIVEVENKELKILVRSKKNIAPISKEKIQNLLKWNDFISSVRDFFNRQKFTELRTPTLVPSPGLEPFLDPFETHFKMGKTSQKFYLPTSPEFHLKKALCLGFEKIFEFKECFRNGEISELHQPEFLMLEWYRAYENLEAIKVDLQGLTNHLAKELGYKGNIRVETLHMKEIWKRFLDFDLTPQTTAKDLQKIADAAQDDDFDDLFARIWVDKIEPQLDKIDHPVIIYGFPPSQAALAKLTADGWADRLEFYWKGLEIANSFHELNDSDEQQRRFLKDQEKKRQLGKDVVPIDEDFMEHLRWGMPPAAGIAMGVERLFMAFYDVKKIEDLRLFPISY